MPNCGWGAEMLLHPASCWDPVLAASLVLPKEKCGDGPFRRISASHLGNEPSNRVCHLLAGNKMQSASYSGEMTTNSAKKSLKTHRIVFIQAEERKNKQNMFFCGGLRRAWLLCICILMRCCSCSAWPWATRVPRDGAGRSPCGTALSNHTRQLAWQ